MKARKYTTLKEYAYELHTKDSNSIIVAFYHGINILTGYPQEIFDSVTPSIFVKEIKRVNRSGEKIVIAEIDIDESEVQ